MFRSRPNDVIHFQHGLQQTKCNEKKQRNRALIFLFSCGILFLVSNVSSWGKRKLEFFEDKVDRRLELYDMILGDDVNEEVQEMQRILRTREKCVERPTSNDEKEVKGDPDDSHFIRISCFLVHYKIPRSSVKDIKSSIVFGVLSESKNGRDRRDSIRESWGEVNTVFFILAGAWEEIEEEYNSYGDILWVDQPDIDLASIWDHHGSRPFKTEAFLSAMYENVIKANSNVEYFFKTDDDIHVDVENLMKQIQEKSEKETIDYWGRCIENERPSRDESSVDYFPFLFYPFNYYPSYCDGTGYVVSSKFIECAVGEDIMDTSIYLRNEAHAVGLLAEKCGIQPSSGSLDVKRK